MLGAMPHEGPLPCADPTLAGVLAQARSTSASPTMGEAGGS